ncbi:MAG: alpha/beta hydrolase [Betaproteobacteria bacterium]|jgi:pimeloyl-ACP methyl ester carboxylesterase|uniref:Alpha/beta hydrolase n=1 Tax=Candidatus Proximibacter danicus TaxID=2954365 RepID=A0A9D7K4L1_9PROT|nr:alpha/beta hydrolase [Candidatus Proximibacter danicus]
MGFLSRLFTPPDPRPRMREVLCADPLGLHRMQYTEWGDPANPRVLVCVHGLTRNGRDFDALAMAMSAHYRVVCPDIVGRGRSDWLKDPAGYGFPQYVADMMVLLARLDVPEVHWVGTSMGGLIGMVLASQEHSPISRLLLNDVGPVIATESLQRIGEYVGKAPHFDSYEQAEQYIRFVSAPFGTLTDAQWRALAESSIRPGVDGKWVMVYDPGIGEPFRQAYLVHAAFDLWPIYEGIRCPTMVVRGALSDLLTTETHLQMGQRGPRASLVEVPGVGHAPMFLDAPQIAIVRDFMLGS